MWQKQESNPICWQQRLWFPTPVHCLAWHQTLSSHPSPQAVTYKDMSSAAFLRAHPHRTELLLFHQLPLAIYHHVNKPSRFLQVTEMWKLLSFMVSIQGLRTCQPLHIGCSLMYSWSQFNFSQNSSTFSCHHVIVRWILILEQPGLLWDFPPCIDSSNKPPSARLMLSQNKLGIFVSWAVLWPQDPVLLSLVPSQNLFPFLRFHFHFSGLL